MVREVLRVDGVSAETIAQLQASALRDYGRANASLVVRALIASHLAKNVGHVTPKSVDLSGDIKQIQTRIRLPKEALAEIDRRAEDRFSSRQHYISALILAHLGQPQLLGDEIEVLRRSNYELAKVGTNLNQIAKAFNLLVKAQSGGKLPEVGKRIAALKADITAHTGRVLKLLKAGSTLWDSQGPGRGQAKEKRTKRKG